MIRVASGVSVLLMMQNATGNPSKAMPINAETLPKIIRYHDNKRDQARRARSQLSVGAQTLLGLLFGRFLFGLAFLALGFLFSGLDVALALSILLNGFLLRNRSSGRSSRSVCRLHER